jgi:hypothetical protein
MKKVVWSATARIGIVALSLGTVTCGDLTRQGQASSYLIINELAGASGAEPDLFSGVLFSDVLTIVDVDDVLIPTIFADNGRVTLSLGLKDPGPPTSPNAPSQNNFITVNRYRVRYTRADGRNTPGVDVPFGFDGAVTFTVGAGAVTQTFTLVRHVAKQEAPLAALVSSPASIATITEITFYGHDQTGREVSVTGTILVQFGNFGDPS